MKKIWITLGLTVILALAVMPQKNETIYVHQSKPEIEMFEVDIQGPFPYAGTYHFFEPVTIQKALSYAGTPYADFDDSKIIYSEMITRNRTIYLPVLDGNEDKPQTLVNINEASFKELIDIPYMTESRAASLIIYRELNGSFLSIDDLIHVKYIGSVTLENLRPYITCS
ncbi:MAG: helix-hairpin-helix domain-containing protein [Acholeplasmataceae bacterium]|nr:helix-hairpin-helix domain-containing protein [Acholeplasmataceae bacterium]